MLVKRMLAILGPLLCNLRASYLIQINSKIFISVEQRSWKREEDSKRRLGSWPLWDSKYLPLGPHSVSSYFSSSQCTHPHIKVLDCLLTGELNFSEMDVLLGLIRMFLLRTRNCKMCQLVVCECVFKYQLCVCVCTTDARWDLHWPAHTEQQFNWLLLLFLQLARYFQKAELEVGSDLHWEGDKMIVIGSQVFREKM